MCLRWSEVGANSSVRNRLSSVEVKATCVLGVSDPAAAVAEMAGHGEHVVVALLVAAMVVLLQGAVALGATNEVKIEPVRYSEPNISLQYHATDKFDPRGMAHLYRVTNIFMRLVQRQDPYPQGFVVVRSDGSLQLADVETEWRTLLLHYAGVVAVVAIGVSSCLALVLSSAAVDVRVDVVPDRSHLRNDGIRARELALASYLLGSPSSFYGTQKLPSRLRTSINDTKLYLSNTETRELAEVSRAIVLTNLTALVKGLEGVKGDLQDVQNITRSLQSNADRLTHKLNKCNSSCQESLQKYVANMSTSADFQQLPQIEDSLSSVTELIVNDRIKDKVTQGLQEFDKIQQEIQNAVQDLIPQISQSMARAGHAMADQARHINTILRRVNSVVTNHSSRAVDAGEKLIAEYGYYRYYAGLSVSSIMLLILLCATLGLFYGFCGKRPDGYGDDCCSRATGARFLILGVWVMFLCSAVLMLVTLAHFLVGIVAERAVCEPLQTPGDNQFLRLVDESIRLDDVLEAKDVNVSSIIASCHANASIYTVLQVASLANISEVSDYKRRFDIENKIQQLKTRIDFGGNVTLLAQDAKRELQRLARSNATHINFAAFADVLNKSIVNIDLETLASQLRKTAGEVAGNSPDIARSLEYQAQSLESLQVNVVRQMETQVRALDMKTRSLQDTLKFNHSSLNESIQLILEEVTRAQIYLNTTATSEIKKLADHFATAILDHIDQYLNRVVNLTTSKVGQCHPMSRMYNATVVSVCNQILDPFNGFWASIGWCLVLFVPAIVLSVKLAALYQKSDPYPGPLVESVDKKNYHRRYHESYENASGYYGGGDWRRERASPGGDTRYTDMAPKHWDYPNGGPPRYHSPPLSTEYERPPPYYYPGPGYAKYSV
ncbi:hypothetical protein C0J52_11617 [Blattella germanica]|nr:hypothetical protein C0J52_11617 [Blattella germanica]